MKNRSYRVISVRIVKTGDKTTVRFNRWLPSNKTHTPSNASLDRVSRLIEERKLIPYFCWIRNHDLYAGTFLMCFRPVDQ